jgi:hypothetical protein
VRVEPHGAGEAIWPPSCGRPCLFHGLALVAALLACNLGSFFEGRLPLVFVSCFAFSCQTPLAGLLQRDGGEGETKEMGITVKRREKQMKRDVRRARESNTHLLELCDVIVIENY